MILIKVVLVLLSVFGAGWYIYKGITFRRATNGEIVGVGQFSVIRIPIAIVFLTAVLILLSAINVVPAGHRGVVFSQVSGVQNRQLQEGLNLVMPFVESVVMIDVRTDKKEAKGAAASKDLQNVTLDVLANYNPDPSKVNVLYQKVGERAAIEAKIIEPAVQEIVKSVTPRFTAEEIIQKRHIVKEMIFRDLSKRLLRSNIILTEISLVNISFEGDYAVEIEQKAKQEQIAQREELIVRQKEAIAKQKIAEAEGDKQSKILRAQGEAEANRLLAESITLTVLQLRFLDKWNGEYPMYLGGNGGMLLQLPAPASTN